MAPAAAVQGIGNTLAPSCDSDGGAIASGWGRPSCVRDDERETGVAPYTTGSRRRSAGSTSRADVRANHCCGTTWPSGLMTASITRDAHPGMLEGFVARRGSSPVRGHAAWSSPYYIGVDSGAATVPVSAASVWSDRQKQPQPQPPPQGDEHAVRSRAVGMVMALSHAAAYSPDCECSMAWAGCCKVGNSSVWRKWGEQARGP